MTRSAIPVVHTSARPALPGLVVCPTCRGRLEATDGGARCSRCGRPYQWERGFLSLLPDPADRFDDERQEERDREEERFNTHSTLGYTLPLLHRLLGTATRGAGAEGRPRILSSGCGVAVDVDLFNDHGCEAYGIDCGERVWTWTRRRYPERLFIANSKSLPFPDESFDFVTTGCLLPHVGVSGDTTTVRPDFQEQRRQVAHEMVRVVRPGGHIFMASPNRRCPLDVGHLHDRPRALARLHRPSEPFLLSLEDYRRLFVREGGCRSLEVLPLAGYFGFLQKSQHSWQRVLVPPVRLYFRWLSSGPLSWLRASALDPWLVVLVRR